jgi:isopentenyl-diphosphate delta-isomerase
MNRTEKRKLEHIDICLKKRVSFTGKTTLLEDMDLVYSALPELDMKGISTGTSFLGRRFSSPFMASAMTGGAKKAGKINRDVAKACQSLGIGMELGSQRAMLEKPELASTYMVRDVAPDIFLAGNIGVTQLRDYSVTELRSAMSLIGADALCVHVNAAQEIVQPEGSHDFRGGLKMIAKVSGSLKLPVIVKEVGHGISKEIAGKLSKTKVAAIDIQGAGGTSWVAVDSLRGRSRSAKPSAGMAKGGGVEGAIFRNVGIPTAASLFEVRSAFKRPVIASGGIRTGLDAAKCIAAGASLCGLAMPILKAQAKGGSKAVEKAFIKLDRELKTAMFMTCSTDIKRLSKAEYTVSGCLREWLEQRKVI